MLDCQFDSSRTSKITVRHSEMEGAGLGNLMPPCRYASQLIFRICTVLRFKIMLSNLTKHIDLRVQMRKSSLIVNSILEE